MAERTHSPELIKRMLELMWEGSSVAELARWHQPGRTTLRRWKSEELVRDKMHPATRPASRESAVLNARMRCFGRTRPFWKRSRPGCQPIGTSWQERLKLCQFMRSHQCRSEPLPGKIFAVTAMCRVFDACNRSWRSGVREPRSGARLWLTPDHSCAAAGRFRRLPEAGAEHHS